MINLDKLNILLELAELLTNYDTHDIKYNSEGVLYTEQPEPGSFYRYLESIIPVIPRQDEEIKLYRHDIELLTEFNIVNNNVPVYAHYKGYFLCTEQSVHCFKQCPFVLLECVYQIDSLQREEGFSGYTSESVTGHSVSRSVNTKTGIPSYLDDILNRYRRPIIGDLNDKISGCL